MPKHPLRLIVPILILIIAGVAGWYVLSRPAPQTGIPGMENPPEASSLKLEEHGQYYDLEASYPASTPLRESAGIEADANAVASMKSYLQQDMGAFKESSGVSGLTPEDIQMWGLGVDRKITLDIDYTGYRGGNTVSYLFHVYADTLGAHPNALYESFVFHAKTGAQLTLSDLFVPGAPYLTILSDIARKELPGFIAAKGGISVDDVDVEYIRTGTEPVIENFRVFYLDKGNLVIVFNPYQVGPWVIGVQELAIPRSELSGSLNADFE